MKIFATIFYFYENVVVIFKPFLRSLPRKRYRESDDEDFYEKENHIPKVDFKFLIGSSNLIFSRDV